MVDVLRPDPHAPFVMRIDADKSHVYANSILRELQQKKVKVTNTGMNALDLHIYVGAEHIIPAEKTHEIDGIDGVFRWGGGRLDAPERTLSLTNEKSNPETILALQRRSLTLQPAESILLDETESTIHEINCATGVLSDYKFNIQYDDGILSFTIDQNREEKASIQDTPAAIRFLKPTARFASTKDALEKYVDEIAMLSSLYKDLPDTEDIFQSTCTRVSGSKIPRINHRAWLNPFHDAPLISVKRYVNNTKLLGDKWMHILWCLDKSTMTESIEYLRINSPHIHVRELREITDHLWPDVVFDGLMKDSYCTIISNIARIFVLYKIGGVYCDLGCELFPEIIVPLNDYQHIFAAGRKHNQLLEGFIAGVKESPFFFDLLKLYKNFVRLNYSYMQSIDERNDGGVGLLSSKTYPVILSKMKHSTSYLITSERSFYKFNSLQTWAGKAKYGNKSISSQRITTKLLLEYFNVNEDHLEKDTYGTLISDYSLARCSLVELIDQHFYGLSREDVVARRKFHYEKAKSIYLDKAESARKTIPHIQQRFWLTSPDAPEEVPVKLLQAVKNSLSVLTEDWETIFWFNVPERLPETTQWINDNIPGAQIRNTTEISDCMRGKEIFDILYGMKRFANASILLRFNVIDLRGGICADMGTLLNGDTETAIDNFDYIFSQRDYFILENWLDVNLMASKPHADLWGHLFAFIDSLGSVTLHFDFSQLKRYLPIDEDHAWISGPALSAAIDATLTVDDAILPMCFGSLFKSGSTGSWGYQPKFGSNGVRTHKHKFVKLPEIAILPITSQAIDVIPFSLTFN
ncbi:MAG: hypothetical protein V4482_00285 [Pseudomonadota bacterium]